MKQMINKLITALLSLLAVLACIISCDDMNEIQREFADREEQVYLGKVDSIKSIPGFGKAKLTWYLGSDPKIEQTIIYWNERQDSIVRNVTRTSSDLLRDSIIIENLPEGSTLFEFRNVNSNGQTSLFTSATATVWGETFADGLRVRRLTKMVFNYEQSNYVLALSPATAGDSVVYSQIIYTDNQGAEKTIKIERATNEVELANFADGAEFHFRNVFFLPQGMDTVYGRYQEHKAPKAVFENGKKISFPGNPNSRYSEHTATSLYEWNLQGDLILYQLNADGSLTQSESYPGLVPRATYREFFFYDDDKFIGVGTNNQIFMFQIENYELTFVKSGANNYFGTGFTFPVFIPARGFFFVISAAGAMNAWYVNNKAVLGNPTNTAVATNFLYNPVTLFDSKYIVAVDAEGYLWSIPISTIGIHRGLNKIGSGWDKFVKLITVGQKLIAVDANGEFYEFDFNATNNYWVIE
ncbi:DUF4998 domain-containing protein [Proteiniphilum sp.]|uniref:DUF4998 domain-containing protein n=1 Tax=Proteiniphilum sp. TaxID=1926877 RepID=UPI002B20C2D8|nr:DUF4998 domain-containing protein [Proteiniphilum sp.]MEA4917088.1 DUF4998 domain-containing protein [Proteiniphilum sp.]